MSNEKNAMITYNGNQITFFSDGVNDYINLTEMAKAWKYRKSIMKWMKNRQTIEFLVAWEKRHNTNFDGTRLGTILQSIKSPNFSLSVGLWIENTKAIGIFTRQSGTFAHKDIAIRFGGWLSPEFELYLVEEIQRLKKIEEQIKSNEFIDKKTILYLIEIKEVFKYVANQKAAEETHKEVFAANSNAKNPYADFNKWRNEILNLTEDVINKRIEQYCKEKGIAVTKKIFNKTKHEKLLMLDSYEAVRNAVWDYLKIDGQIDALNLANLVYDIIKMEKGEVLRHNEDTLFENKQRGYVADFPKQLSEHPNVQTAKQILSIKKEQAQKQLSSPFNKALKGLLTVPPPPKTEK